MYRIFRSTGLAAMICSPVVLSACQQQSGLTVSAARCEPARHQALVGRNIGAVTLPSELPQRVVIPGATLTDDVNPDRLNIFVDPKGWIARISCG